MVATLIPRSPELPGLLSDGAFPNFGDRFPLALLPPPIFIEVSKIALSSHSVSRSPTDKLVPDMLIALASYFFFPLVVAAAKLPGSKILSIFRLFSRTNVFGGVLRRSSFLEELPPRLGDAF